MSVYLNSERGFSFVELRSVALTTAAMALDGILYKEHPLKVKLKRSVCCKHHANGGGGGSGERERSAPPRLICVLYPNFPCALLGPKA